MATQENQAAFADHANATAIALISVAIHGATSGPVDVSPALATLRASIVTAVGRASTVPLSLGTVEVVWCFP